MLPSLDTVRVRARTIAASLAMPDVSAANRPIVEEVRSHLLPRSVIEFVATDGSPITLDLSGDGTIERLVETMEIYREARGVTYIPTLVDHDGAAVGPILRFEATERGADVIHGLWAEGSEARKGRDFVSGFFEFDGLTDGVPTECSVMEVSFTPKPQFAFGQEPVIRVPGVPYDSRVAASICAAAYTPPTEDSEMMTPEEMVEAALPTIMEKIGAELPALVTAALEAMTAPEEEEVAAAEGEEVEETAEAEETEEVEASEEAPAEVAASEPDEVAALRAENRRLKVAAALKGRKHEAVSVHTPPNTGLDGLAARVEAGFHPREASRQIREVIANTPRG